ncbi:MAG: ABC transporter permease [Capnocytophaga sp.]|nr:ABC transporter permease [Capnocytophaga sp.]
MSVRFVVIRENIKIAFESIKGQLLRTILTVLIIAIGITALVGILSVITALRNTLEGNFSEMGANTFTITRYEYTQRTQGSGTKEKINPPISYQNAVMFKNELESPLAQTSISLLSASSAEVKYENHKTDPSTSVIGVDEHYIQNSGLEIENGRDFNELDIENSVAVCIIGSDFTKTLLKDVNPIGKVISIRGHKFTIIGVLKTKGSTFGNNEDVRVFIPLGIARSAFAVEDSNFEIKVRVADKDKLEGVMDDALVVMRNIRGLRPLDEKNFGVERSDDLLHRIESMTQGIGIAGFVIGLITILGSSIALLNIMLVSVTERTKEIGIRKALGAHRKAITMQFFTETIIIAQLGAITGIVLGISLGYLISKMADFEFTIPWAVIFVAILIAFVVAIISGLYPAVKASKLDPVEALRYE